MKTNNLKGRIGGAILAFSLVLGIGIASSMTAQAQYRNDGQWQRRDRNRDQTDNQDQNQDWRRNRDRSQTGDQYRVRRDDRYRGHRCDRSTARKPSPKFR